MNRLGVIWVAVGAAAGMIVVRKLIATGALSDWWSEVRGYAEERELELRTALGLDEGEN